MLTDQDIEDALAFAAVLAGDAPVSDLSSLPWARGRWSDLILDDYICAIQHTIQDAIGCYKEYGLDRWCTQRLPDMLKNIESILGAALNLPGEINHDWILDQLRGEAIYELCPFLPRVLERLLSRHVTYYQRTDRPEYRYVSNVCGDLNRLGLGLVLTDPVATVLFKSIDSKLSRSCKAVFHKRTLGPCLRWIDDYLIPWLCIAFGCDDSSQDDFIYPWRTRLIRHFHRCFFGLRVSELFEIIVEFPYSRCALLDLLESLKVTDRSELLVSSLSKSIGKRLLQPGATTATIVDFYIALQKSVLLLDPVGAMTQTLGDPIKQYLRQRSDTVKCIISKLIDSPGSEGGQHDDGNNDLAVESEEGPLPESIVRNLLSIYDTYDVFVKEFQSSLASRLCRLPNYDTVLEMAQVEHLKTRIDESNLQNCEVMLRDIFDSKRIDSLIHETGFFKVPLHSRILSRQYWPPLEQEMFKLPDAVQSQMEEYQKMYGDIKQGRALKWIPSAGTVSLTLDLKDRRLTLDVTPFQASIISCFENQAEWTLAKLAAHLETSDSTLKKRMAYWIKMNVISEPADGVYRLIEELDPLAHDAEVKSAFVPANDAHGRPAQRTTAEPEEMWAFHIQTIMGLFPALTAEELLQKMQMMSFNGNVDNVKALLQVLVVDGKVKACGQTYSLKQ